MLQGLSSTEAKQNLTKYGFNEIIEVAKTTPLKILLRQIEGNFIIYMLTAAAIISFVVGKPLTAYTIIAVILSVIFVGFFQEYKAEESISSLRKMLMPISIVYRDGKKTELPSKEIVPGDIIILGNGEKIPADAELGEAFDLRVNESILTGESSEISKSVENIDNEENRIFMGTYVVNGRCVAKVTHTGMNTKFGKIAHLISTAEKELPLQKKVNNIAKYMVTIAIITSLATGLLMAFRTPTLNAASITEILILMVALAVSAFPEGFPVVLATTLAIGAKKMAQKNAIVNRMSIIETLGEVTVICSDKTGTITRGEMTVKFVYTKNDLYEVEGSGYIVHGNILENGEKIDLEKHIDLNKLIETATICNDAGIERTGNDNEYHTLGSPTEAALLILGAKVGMYEENYIHKRISEYPFNSMRKLMSVLVEQNGKHTIYAKGAPEVLLEKCTKILNNGKEEHLSDDEKQRIYKLQKEMASTAYRTLAFAYKGIAGPSAKYDEGDLVLLGIVAMEDPPREEVADAIKVAQNAGIKVLMITGDNRETAISIAKQVGLQTKILDGTQIDQLSDQELVVALKDTTVFARVKPEHKIRIIKILKELKETVAMTGDGVNDAPALKEAHVGIAMGKNGTDVSRSVADLVLKDDNFATIVTAISEGRTVYSNIRKFVTYQLSCSLAEIIVLFLGVLLAPVFGWQTPMLISMQILFMNLVTDNMPALTLGVNPSSKDIMEEKPRNNEDILSRDLMSLLIITAIIMALATLISYYIAYNIAGFSNETSRTVAMLTLILVEIITAFSYRSFRKLTINRSLFINKPLAWASFASIILTLVIIYTPVSSAFEATHLGYLEWLIAVGCSVVVLVLNDLIKLLSIKHVDYLTK